MSTNRKQQRAEAKAAKATTMAHAILDAREANDPETIAQAEKTIATKAPKAPKAPIVDATGTPMPIAPKAKKTRKPKPAQVCACGCGNSTKGGRFVSGHDSYLRSWCLQVERGTIAVADIPHAGVRAAVEAHMTPKQA